MRSKISNHNLLVKIGVIIMPFSSEDSFFQFIRPHTSTNQDVQYLQPRDVCCSGFFLVYQSKLLQMLWKLKALIISCNSKCWWQENWIFMQFYKERRRCYWQWWYSYVLESSIISQAYSFLSEISQRDFNTRRSQQPPQVIKLITKRTGTQRNEAAQKLNLKHWPIQESVKYTLLV